MLSTIYRVKMHRGNSGGESVTISPVGNGKSMLIPYDYSKNNAKEVAIDYLEKEKRCIIVDNEYSEIDKAYYLIVTVPNMS